MRESAEDSPSALEGKAQRDFGAGELLLAQGDLLGWAESLAAHAFVNLLDLATGLQECSNLRID